MRIITPVIFLLRMPPLGQRCALTHDVSQCTSEKCAKRNSSKQRHRPRTGIGTRSKPSEAGARSNLQSIKTCELSFADICRGCSLNRLTTHPRTNNRENAQLQSQLPL